MSSDTLIQELSELSSQVKELSQTINELKKELEDCREITKQVIVDYQFLKPSVDILTVEVNDACSQLQEWVGELVQLRRARSESPPHNQLRQTTRVFRLPSRISRRWFGRRSNRHSAGSATQ